jgi:hypothetical protein
MLAVTITYILIKHFAYIKVTDLLYHMLNLIQEGNF